MAENDAFLPNTPEKRSTVRQEIEETFASVRGLIKASLRPLPTQTGDGTYIVPPETAGLVEDLKTIGVADVQTLLEMVKSSINGEPTDDKKYLMERLIELTSELPLSSKNSLQLTHALVDRLWSDLQHPPLSYLGDEHMYRQADGSYNV